MKIYILKEFWSNGHSEGHYQRGIFSTYEIAKRKADELGLKIKENSDPLWSDYIDEVEIE